MTGSWSGDFPESTESSGRTKPSDYLPEGPNETKQHHDQTAPQSHVAGQTKKLPRTDGKVNKINTKALAPARALIFPFSYPTAPISDYSNWSELDYKETMHMG